MLVFFLPLIECVNASTPLDIVYIHGHHLHDFILLHLSRFPQGYCKCNLIECVNASTPLDIVYIHGHHHLSHAIDYTCESCKSGSPKSKGHWDLLPRRLIPGTWHTTTAFCLRLDKMVKFTAEELRRIMDYKHNIRNMSVIAHVDHGKSTLTDSLVAAAGIIAQEVAGDVRMTDTRADEAERGITIKSTGISLYYEMTDAALKSFKGERNGNEYLINLIDSPGHVDFSSEVTAALRITDGALVVVDCIEGVCVQTETVLRQALGERIRPVLTVNKMDRCFLELQVDGEEAYQTFQRVIENANVIMATYEDPLLGDVMVYPEKGTVAFSAGLHGWAFTLTNFAKMYASKFGVDESKMMERLWGENFFDPKTKKWTTKSTGSSTCKRGFVQFCYEPIKQIINTCMNDQKDQLWPMLTKLGVTMKSDEKELMGKALMKRVMQTWLPAATALLEMMIFHLPSPHTARHKDTVLRISMKVL
ncbi:unnamed protein product [Lactuca virosa]|uniref:Tr-type G domain-containing protein n=1 Tax=Lactuca virosa TaxID=75947 RepID=A0AAU9PKJ6_9ASTR|nr:unnamed protein product [Lactuca virosa]